MNTYNEYQQQGGTEAGREGKLSRQIEEKTAKVPSNIFLWAAGAAIVGSLALQIMGMRASPIRRFGGIFSPLRRSESRAPLASFVGMWVPTLVALGTYNRLMKGGRYERFGSERFGRE